MIVTIRSRALEYPRRLASWALSGRSNPADPEAYERALRRSARLRRLAIVVLAVCLLTLLAVWGTGYRYAALPLGGTAAADTPPPVPGSSAAPEVKALSKDNRKLRAELAKNSPRGPYIVIDRANNRLFLKRDETVVLEAACSSGSGLVLREANGGRSWVFDTPSGSFRVLAKSEDPVWRKPDWAFVEEGLAIPKNPTERIEYGVLGEYALHIGNGYMIHGTLYERLLGRSVTHGCVRLGQNDLRQVYKAATIGTPVYIF